MQMLLLDSKGLRELGTYFPIWFQIYPSETGGKLMCSI